MKKLFVLFLFSALFFSAPVVTSYAQAEEPSTEVTTDDTEESTGIQEKLKQWYIDGDWRFMTLVLVCLIIGLTLCIERIITLNLNSVDAGKLTEQVTSMVRNGNIEGAKELTKNTRGPVASILYEGLSRSNEGPDNVEKAIEAYAGVQMNHLERGLTWISLFIAIAPMLGFMGTVIGMIQSFEDIRVAGDISPQIVAGGIKVALLTTVFGLVVAIILQIFYNYILSKVDGMVADMEESTIEMVDAIALKS